MRKTIVITVFLTGFNLFAQRELGKVTKEELEQKRHPRDTAAVAAVLFDIGRTTFDYTADEGFVNVTEVKTKIKIYKKDGYEWANKAVAYYKENNSDKLSFSDCATYNLVDGKIVKTKLKSEGEFDEKVNRYWGQKKIALPNVKEGSVVEYSYILRTPHIGKLNEWSFQKNIPVDYSQYTTNIPEYLTYAVRMKGFFFAKGNQYLESPKGELFIPDRYDAGAKRRKVGTYRPSNGVCRGDNRLCYRKCSGLERRVVCQQHRKLHLEYNA